LPNDTTYLMTIFEESPCKLVPNCRYSGSFYWSKDDGGDGDNWSYKTCKAPLQSSPPTNQHPNFLQAGCPSCHPTNNVGALKGESVTFPRTCSPQAHLGVSSLSWSPMWCCPMNALIIS